MWSIYKRPDGKEVKVWHVTDPSNTPSGIVAGWSQIIIQEERPLPDNPEEVYMAEYVMDGVPNEWELQGDLPEGVAPANPSIPGVHNPMADLWRYDQGSIVAIAYRLGVQPPEGSNWLRKDWIHAVHEARMAQQVKIDVRGDGKVTLVPMDEEEPAEAEVEIEAEVTTVDEAKEPTKLDLLERAKELGLSGYSALNKPELEKMIAKAEKKAAKEEAKEAAAAAETEE